MLLRVSSGCRESQQDKSFEKTRAPARWDPVGCGEKNPLEAPCCSWGVLVTVEHLKHTSSRGWAVSHPTCVHACHGDAAEQEIVKQNLVQAPRSWTCCSPPPPAGHEATSGRAVLVSPQRTSHTLSHVPDIQPVREPGRCLSRAWVIPWYFSRALVL